MFTFLQLLFFIILKLIVSQEGVSLLKISVHQRKQIEDNRASVEKEREKKNPKNYCNIKYLNFNPKIRNFTPFQLVALYLGVTQLNSVADVLGTRNVHESQEQSFASQGQQQAFSESNLQHQEINDWGEYIFHPEGKIRQKDEVVRKSFKMAPLSIEKNS